ncbi:MAG: nucleotidyl transferase AbiEii/AbiGii toxin family protein [Candidatus Buchananbacteria bacterium]|jgi:predicted nucleotidyltransferase component of viral defense system
MTVNYAKHKNILLQILKDVYSDTSISSYLGFKGGTAAHLFYGLNRDSFDLDFDLLDESKEQEVFEKIQKIAENYGKVIDSKIKKFNLLNVISYDTVSQNIKIEVNRRNFGSRFDVKVLLGISMLVMIPEDMFANKLIAMLERVGKTSRDIYDVWFFLKNNWPINKEIVEMRSGVSFGETLQKCIDQMEKVEDRNLLVGLGEALTEPQKDWARAKLKSETIFLLRARMESEK